MLVKLKEAPGKLLTAKLDMVFSISAQIDDFKNISTDLIIDNLCM